ncbi:Gfo/Idh/MocA family oxidoreductase [Gracilibacillus sp. YIM 98692]|uniref:Gfo/Idh/MocA family protein n=1 Tax=Gracilibacillus sp. YIM 98692 TaxID=2663532 RepID=UPI0013D06B56|nr:Gfo/Idh/MocA family oxidoreductase [Gracilibacillus sp. YIM 98692]
MSENKFGLIGSGWRAEFFIRIAQQVPEKFELTSVLVRDKEKGEKFAKKHGVKVVQSLDEMMEDNPDYVVLSIKRGVITDYLIDLFKRNIPVLSETPPGESIESLEKLWNAYKKYNGKIQVAEQYLFQPLYASWLKCIEDGKLGEIENMNISALHGYHAVSIIRKYLDTGFDHCKIYGKRFHFDVTKTSGREGIRYDGEISSCSRDRLTFEFDNGKVAFFDFSGSSQYHSFIRTRQLTVQGVRGEIDDLTIRYLTSENVPVSQELNRIDLGKYHNQGWSHFGIMLGDQSLYKNPLGDVRLNDDEIAVATCMLKMEEYLRTGKDFYSLKDGLQDTYISLKMDEALNNPNQEVETRHQVWSNE